MAHVRLTRRRNRAPNYLLIPTPYVGTVTASFMSSNLRRDGERVTMLDCHDPTSTSPYHFTLKVLMGEVELREEYEILVRRIR